LFQKFYYMSDTQCWGFVDPYLWLMDPTPFLSGFKDAIKKFKFFFLYLPAHYLQSCKNCKLIQSAQHLYEKRVGSGAGSATLTNGSGAGSGFGSATLLIGPSAKQGFVWQILHKP
jgi:hypothetical protein